MMMSIRAGIPVDKGSFYFLLSLIRIRFERFEPIRQLPLPV